MSVWRTLSTLKSRHPRRCDHRGGPVAGYPARGFTAIELLITVAIVAILATVALPAYNNTLVRANRAAAQSYLLDLANREEQYLLDARTYTTTSHDLLSPPSTVCIQLHRSRSRRRRKHARQRLQDHGNADPDEHPEERRESDDQPGWREGGHMVTDG